MNCSMIIIAEKRDATIIANKYPNALIIDISYSSMRYIRYEVRNPYSMLNPFYPHGKIKVPFTDGYTGVSTTNIAGAIKYNGSTASIWLLRSAYSGNGNYFYTGWLSGGWSYRDANNSYGVSPAFRLAN